MTLALAIQHVAFEDLGTLADALREAGLATRAIEAASVDWAALDPLADALVVVLGGPIGVYERQSYPFLNAEIDFLAARLKAQRPTLGVCLGAQMIAAALGAPPACR